MHNALGWSAVGVIVIYFGHTCLNMNTDVNVQSKHVGCEIVTNYSAILFVNVAEYQINAIILIKHCVSALERCSKCLATSSVCKVFRAT